MKIIRYPQNRPLSDSSCVTIGNFDGIHLGHQALICDVINEARKRQLQSVVVTMQPFPAQYFNGRNEMEVLTSFKHKANFLANMGVDVMCVLNFNLALANMSAQNFYSDILVSGLKAQYIMVGDDFRFGKSRKGDFNLLKQWSKTQGIEVNRMQSVEVNGSRVSSSAIRSLLKGGDFIQAKQMLGRHFNLFGRVAHGRKMGRELGYPTINIELKKGGFPLQGIYVTHIVIGEKVYQSMTSVGINPTVGGNAKRVEVFVFDFNKDVYGQTVEVLFYKKIRNEVEFDSLSDLTLAIEQDVKAGRDFFAKYEGELV